MRLFLVVVLLGLMSAVHAQNIDKYLFLGKEAEEAKEYYKAVALFAQGAAISTTNAELNFHLAECLRILNDYELAEKFYQLTIVSDTLNQFPIALFWTATMQKNNGHYEEALANWELLQRLYASNPSSDTYKKATQEIIVCAEVLKGNIPEFSYKITNLKSINTVNAEFAASYYDSSSMVYSKLDIAVNSKNNAEFIQLHSGIRQGSDWIDGFLLPPAINQTGFQNANGNFSSDHKFFVFTRCDKDLNCFIYISRYKNGVYQEAFPLKVNIPGFNSTQPHLANTDNGYVLFFSSNRPGGKGGLDIWYALADENLNLGQAKNLEIVNSSEDEISPFYYNPTQELFFSSTWFTGLGGWDVFKSKTRDLISFSEPENIGRPYNSPANDSYFNINAVGYVGMLTSNREGSISSFGKTCCNDIYEFEYPVRLIERKTKAKEKESITALPNEQIQKLYAELNSLLPLTLYFHNDEPDPKSNRDYTLLSYQDCYYNYYAVRNRYEDRDPAQSQEIYNRLVQPGYDKLERYLDISNQLMLLGASIELDIKGHASPLAKSDYNINLTSRRIESFMNYLKNYRKGVLLPYVVANGNQAQIKVRKLPYGENNSSPEVSDDYLKQDLSVYSFAAAKERRIEIVATRLITPGPIPENSIVIESKPIDDKASTESATEKLPALAEKSTNMVNTPATKMPTEAASDSEINKKQDNLAINTQDKKPITADDKTPPVGSKLSEKGPAQAATGKTIKVPVTPVETALEAAADPVYLSNVIEIDLGKVKRGQLLVKKVKFRNSYGKNINMTRVETDCSCTEIKVPTRLLVPEEETVFTLLFETRGKIGPQEGSATIFTKEIQGHIKIKFKVEVTP